MYWETTRKHFQHFPMENSVVENPYSHQFEQTFIQKRLITADNFTNILVTIVGNIRKIHDPIWMCLYVCVCLCVCALVFNWQLPAKPICSHLRWSILCRCGCYACKPYLITNLWPVIQPLRNSKKFCILELNLFRQRFVVKFYVIPYRPCN